jgi:uncharacterized protein (TIGR03435 family)
VLLGLWKSGFGNLTAVGLAAREASAYCTKSIVTIPEAIMAWKKKLEGVCRCTAAILFQTSLIVSQAQEFDVASVKRSAPDEIRAMKSDSGRIIYTNVSLRDCLMDAYGIRDFQIVGPDWLVTERYDITATLPTPSPEADRRVMLQRLLISRFGITMRRESREIPVYVMTVIKNSPGLRSAGDLEKTDIKTTDGGFLFTHVTAQQIIAYLTMLRLVDRPVVDQTGREGAYDVQLRLYPTGQELVAAMNGGDIGSAVAVAIRDSGLQLERKKLPFEVLLIDSAQKVPAGN